MGSLCWSRGNMTCSFQNRSISRNRSSVPSAQAKLASPSSWHRHRPQTPRCSRARTRGDARRPHTYTTCPRVFQSPFFVSVCVLLRHSRLSNSSLLSWPNTMEPPGIQNNSMMPEISKSLQQPTWTRSNLHRRPMRMILSPGSRLSKAEKSSTASTAGLCLRSAPCEHFR